MYFHWINGCAALFSMHPSHGIFWDFCPQTTTTGKRRRRHGDPSSTRQISRVSEKVSKTLKVSQSDCSAEFPIDFRWFSLTADIYSPIVVAHLISNAIVLTCYLFQFDLVIFISCNFYKINLFVLEFQQRKHLSVEIINSFVGLIFGVVSLFVFCFFGKMATQSYETMADSLYDANWHQRPVKVQKLIMLIIANAQQPLFYHGSGIAVLNLELFTKVILIKWYSIPYSFLNLNWNDVHSFVFSSWWNRCSLILWCSKPLPQIDFKLNSVSIRLLKLVYRPY